MQTYENPNSHGRDRQALYLFDTVATGLEVWECHAVSPRCHLIDSNIFTATKHRQLSDEIRTAAAYRAWWLQIVEAQNGDITNGIV